MTKEEYFDLQESYINNILDYVKETGSLFPHISIIAEKLNTKEGDDKPALIHIPIDDYYMENDDTKDEFVDEVLPAVFKEMKKQFNPKAVAWSSEAWMRVIDKQEDVQNWKEIPIKKEVIMINIESEFEKICHLYEIKRLGKQVNSDGDLVDVVELERLDDMSHPTSLGGRFSGLLKKFNK